MKKLEVCSSSPCHSRYYTNIAKDTIQPHNEFNRQFLDLLKKIFVYTPDKRITAHQALKHKWFKETLQDDGTEATRIRDEKAAALRKKEADEQRRRAGYY
jgi:dual-specificity kinase